MANRRHGMLNNKHTMVFDNNIHSCMYKDLEMNSISIYFPFY